MTTSAAILERFRTSYGRDIDLTLRPAYRELLARLGNPHQHLPPVLHVAGTNGKGSTCAFMRAMLEAAGYHVHVYTSPHLVHFHERIRVAGKLIEEENLAAILAGCEALVQPGGVSYFEAATAAAFVAFARVSADFCILETGLGGRLDATNIVDKPLATIITRLSYDHREYLGDTIEQIAGEKAGIMRHGVPCFTAPQKQEEALRTLRDVAQKLDAPLYIGGEDWRVRENANSFHFTDATRDWDLPAPALPGAHQYLNAGLAIASLSVLPQALSRDVISEGLRRVEWPARLQKLTSGKLADLIPPRAELWLDGGHNDSAGEVLAAQIARWRGQDGDAPRPLYVVLGMLTTKQPVEFLSPFAASVEQLCCVPIPDEGLSFTPSMLADKTRATGIAHVQSAPDVAAALRDLALLLYQNPPRILICGSLYLAGVVLKLNNQSH